MQAHQKERDHSKTPGSDLEGDDSHWVSVYQQAKGPQGKLKWAAVACWSGNQTFDQSEGPNGKEICWWGKGSTCTAVVPVSISGVTVMSAHSSGLVRVIYCVLCVHYLCVYECWCLLTTSNLYIARLQRVLGLQALEGVLDSKHISPKHIIHNVYCVNKQGIVVLKSKAGDWPLSMLFYSGKHCRWYGSDSTSFHIPLCGLMGWGIQLCTFIWLIADLCHAKTNFRFKQIWHFQAVVIQFAFKWLSELCLFYC